MADSHLFRSKVVLKGLPPSITEQHCRQLVSEYIPHCDYVNFIPGKPPNPSNPLTRSHTASLILDFISESMLISFSEKWQGRECREGERRYLTTVQFSPLQFHVKFDSEQSRKQADSSKSVLEDSEMFKKFVEEELEGPAQMAQKEHPDHESFLATDKQSEAIREGERKLKPWIGNPELLKRTPLLMHVEKHKRESKAAADTKTDAGKELKGQKKKGKRGKKERGKGTLPDGFYIDKTPSPDIQSSLKGSDHREKFKRDKVNSSHSKNPVNPDEALKIYDLALEDKPQIPNSPSANDLNSGQQKHREFHTDKLKTQTKPNDRKANGQTKTRIRIAARPSEAVGGSEQSGPAPLQDVEKKEQLPKKFDHRKQAPAGSQPSASDPHGNSSTVPPDQSNQAKKSFSTKALKEQRSGQL